MRVNEPRTFEPVEDEDLTGLDDARATARLPREVEERMAPGAELSEVGREFFYQEVEMYLCFLSEKMEELGLGVEESQIEFRRALRRFRREYLGGASSAWHAAPSA